MDKEPIKPRCNILMLEGTHFGKWQILNYFKNQSHGCLLTLGIQSRTKDFTIEDDNLTLQLWNTSTAQYKTSIFRTLFKIVPGILITHNVASKSSYDKLKNYSQIINDYCRKDAQVFVLMMGKSSKKVEEQLEGIGKDLKFMHLYYIQTEDKIGEQIQKIFNNIAQKLIEKAQIKNKSQQIAYIINESSIQDERQQQQQTKNKNIKLYQPKIEQGEQTRRKCY